MSLEPYYQDDWTTLYCGDMFNVLPQLNVGCVDSCLTDPDYNAKDIGSNSRSYDGGMFHLPPEEYRDFCRRWFAEVQRITPNLIFTPGSRNVWNYPEAKWIVAWHKPGSVCYSGVGGFNIWEPVLIYGKTGRFGEDFVSRTPDNHRPGVQAKHPCPKTLPVWQWLIQHGTKPKWTVLDPFAGSGTTGVVCKKLGRKSILVEIREAYCRIIVERLRQSAMDIRQEPIIERNKQDALL